MYIAIIQTSGPGYLCEWQVIVASTRADAQTMGEDARDEKLAWLREHVEPNKLHPTQSSYDIDVEVCSVEFGELIDVGFYTE